MPPCAWSAASCTAAAGIIASSSIPRSVLATPIASRGAIHSKRNTSTLDDNTTQAALRLLMHVDEALEFKDSAIHEAAEYGLKSLVAAQYPNGAWPQRFSGAAAMPTTFRC